MLALQRAEEPETPVVVHEASATDLFEGLEDGRYDIGIAMGAAPVRHLQIDLLWQDELAVALPERSPLLSYPAVPVEKLGTYTLFECCPYAAEALFGPRPANPCRSTSFELMAVQVAAGYGVGLAPRPLLEQSRNWGVIMRPLTDSTHWVGTHLIRPERGNSPAIERFLRRGQTVA
ncbi:LysR substrate-binding domain-containing protein [Coralloluteibacterium thermophilus]|uniref:LysR substrate-binding domain-containing protein n=1 Tax=Coralloluteibacterium thermophilum TaxID=2707049 RepID=A0ABV9NP69_9GAMM